MPNLFAYFMLLIWPVVVGVLFARLPVHKAVIWSILGGFLLLPEGTEINLPSVPAFDKHSIPSVAVLAFLVLRRSSGFSIGPLGRGAWVLLAMLVVGPFVTALLNSDRVLISGTQVERYLPGLTPYDALSSVAHAGIAILPFLFGRRYLATPEAQMSLLKAFFVAGLAYTLPALFEVRMSPQIHSWVYGFFPHDWQQMSRAGGFRPLVFTRHSLWLTFFLVVAFTSMLVLRRVAPPENRGRFLLLIPYFLVVLVLCKTYSAVIYALFLLPFVLFVAPRFQVRVAIILVLFAVTYPMLRSFDIVPTESLVNMASSLDQDRAQSLQFRFDNEDQLLRKANERPAFGWGGYGRNRVFDEKTGLNVSVTDGTWIIFFGLFGWVGFLARFGLLALPVLLVWRSGRAGIEPTTAALCLILGVNMINLLPNSTLTPWTWLIAGALYGAAQNMARERREQLVTASATGPGGRPPAPAPMHSGPAGRRSLP